MSTPARAAYALLVAALAVWLWTVEKPATGCVDGRDLFEPSEAGSAYMFCDDDGDGTFDRQYRR